MSTKRTSSKVRPLTVTHHISRLWFCYDLIEITEDLVVNGKEFSHLNPGDVIEIYTPEDQFR